MIIFKLLLDSKYITINIRNLLHWYIVLHLIYLAHLLVFYQTSIETFAVYSHFKRNSEEKFAMIIII